MTALLVLAVWFALAVPVAVATGRAIYGAAVTACDHEDPALDDNGDLVCDSCGSPL